MSLFLATGSNLGNSQDYLKLAKIELTKKFNLLDQSQIYTSSAVDYIDQPNFYNQVLEFSEPKDLAPEDILNICLEIEKKLGRTRNIQSGPRTIDIDILFIGLRKIQQDNLIIPHPRLFTRSFVVLPLKELAGFSKIKDSYNFSQDLFGCARPI